MKLRVFGERGRKLRVLDDAIKKRLAALRDAEERKRRLTRTAPFKKST